MASPHHPHHAEVEARENERTGSSRERPPRRESSAAKKMFDDMTSPQKRSMSADPHLNNKRFKRDPSLGKKANSFPLDRYHLKTYVSFKDYQLEEKSQITKSLRILELDISVCDDEPSPRADPGDRDGTRMRVVLEGVRSQGMNEPHVIGDGYLGQTETTNSRRSIHKHSILLLKAPKAFRPQSEYARDEAMRTEEYNAFCKLYPGLVDHSVQKTETTVNTFEEIESSIRMFFSEGASRAVMAVIIFNGHGSKEGLTLSNDDTLPLNKFISKVTLLLDEHREEQESTLPHLVKIVFAQCHGHRHPEPLRHDIWVISFTSDTEPVTESDSEVDQLTLMPKEGKCTHNALKEYSRRCSVAEEMLEMIRQMKPSDVTTIHTVELPILDQ